MPEVIADMRIRNVEEQQRVLKERILLVSKTFVEQRERATKEIQELQKKVIKLTSEMERVQEILKNATEQLNKTTRQEELLTLQRQVDMMRAHGSY
jgi:septation ring formation regulator EzrA